MPGLPLEILLTGSLAGCLALTSLVAARKRRRDRKEAFLTARRARMRIAVTSEEMEVLERCLATTAGDADAQVDLVVTLEAVWPSLDETRVRRLHDAAVSSGLLDVLAASTNSGSWSVRGRAALLLSRLRVPEAASIIAPLLDDADPDVRLAAAGALGTIANANAAVALIHALADELLPSERVIERLAASWAVEPMLNAIETEGRRARPRTAFGRPLRAHLAYALGLANDPRAEEALTGLLASPNVEERIAAARALGGAGTLHAAPAVRAALSDPEWAVRAQAAKTLGLLGDTFAVADLERALSDEGWWVRANSAAALRALGRPGLEALGRALHAADRFARDRAREELDVALVTAGMTS